MRNILLTASAIMILCCTNVKAQTPAVIDLPVRGISIGAPSRPLVDSFVAFINNALGPRKINTMILRVDYQYEYKSHPELVSENPLTKADVKKIADACRKNNIAIVPQINLLGHQSWANKPGKLLEKYPEFDETPWVKFPENYKWPNADSLYCKSYCPLHPGVHKVVFELVDELCDAFGATAFHAGMDEVFYIGMDKCKRCGGKNRAELFANELKTIRDHLAIKNRKLWIWGDRLLDGNSTGIGYWEASGNGTQAAIDLVPKDVVICDWHYERPDKTPVYFALKGFSVITCTWNRPAVSVKQYKDMQDFRMDATDKMRERYLGVIQTIWSDAGNFLREYYADENITPDQRSQAKSFRQIFPVN
jgi:N-acetyl-beta-hexosaminidase